MPFSFGFGVGPVRYSKRIRVLPKWRGGRSTRRAPSGPPLADDIKAGLDYTNERLEARLEAQRERLGDAEIDRRRSINKPILIGFAVAVLLLLLVILLG